MSQHNCNIFLLHYNIFLKKYTEYNELYSTSDQSLPTIIIKPPKRVHQYKIHTLIHSFTA